MAKKRGKKSKALSKKSKVVKKAIKSNFQENEVSHTEYKSSIISKSNDYELKRELEELETHRYYGRKPEIYKYKEKIDVDKSKLKTKLSNRKLIYIFLTIIGIISIIYFISLNNWFLFYISLLFSFVASYNTTCEEKNI